VTELADRLQASLGDQYRIERELTGAGMSRLFVAEDVALGRKVVIKLLPSDLAASLNVERFKREVQFAAKLQHACIVPILAAGVSDGLPYYTMPFVEGQSLRERLAAGGPLPIPEIIRILRDILGALSYAHEHGVVHRDIKPGNVMLTRHHALLVDFGIAKAVSASSRSDAALTSTGLIVGTPAYMAPEQAVADPTANQRADLYSVGALAYEMLTGKGMFTSRSAQGMLAAHVLEKPEPVSSVRKNLPAELATLVMSALEKDPSNRPQSADDMLRSLDAIDISDGARRQPVTAPVRKLSLRSRWLAGGVAVLVSIAAVFAIVSSRRVKESLPQSGLTRIMIVPFRNGTGDMRLDPFGLIATERITQGLTENGIAEVVAQPGTDPRSGSATRPPITVDQIRAQARELKAGRIVSGSYLRQGDSVEFHATLAVATDGRVVAAINKAAPLSDPMPAIDAIRTTIAAILTGQSQEMSELTASDVTPSFEAYKEYLRGWGALDERKWTRAVSHFTRAAELDTTWLAPLIRARYAYIGLDQCGKSDSLGAWLELRSARISPFDGHLLDAMSAWCRGDHSGVYSAASRLVKMAPQSPLAIFVAARTAMWVDRLHESLALLERLDPKVPHGNWYYDVLCQVLHGLGSYDRELLVANTQRQQYSRDLFPLRNQVRALAALGRVSEIDSIIQTSQSMPSQEALTPAVVMLTAALELDAHGRPADAHRVGSGLVRWLERRSNDSTTRSHQIADLAQAYCVAGKCQDARVIADELSAVAPTDDYSIKMLGIAAARDGDRATANRALHQLESMRVPYALGRIKFEQATILATLGDRQRAFALLLESISEGMPLQEDVNHAEYGLENLRSYQPFQALLKSRD
jgi:serine/threonine protein kinase/tetratricopeptide (TPR) repeat protein